MLEIEKQILKFIWKCKVPKANIILKNKNKTEKLTLSNIRIYCKIIVLKTVFVQNRQIDQQNKREGPKFDLER